MNYEQLTINNDQISIKSGGEMKEENVVYEKAYQFAIRIVKAYQYLTQDSKEFVLSKQLLRCGTSIGANIAEANGAISKRDFSNKISIAYKLKTMIQDE